ncbi:MAG: hypothetical protein AAF798_09625 [Bacteroidota bacterium]
MKSVYEALKYGRPLLLLLCLLWGITPIAAAEKGAYTKTIKKEFPIAANGVVNVQNKYGKIAIETWDRDRVKVNVKISVTASSEKKAQEVFDRIRVDFMNKPDYIKAVTEIGSKKSNWWSWSNGGDGDFDIDYTILMPKRLNLELTNKHGDISISSIDGWAKVWLKHGNFEIKEVADDVHLDIAHGNGTLVKGTNVKVTSKHANVSIAKAEDIELQSKHTNISIADAGDVSCNTKYDNYIIGTIQEFKNTGGFDNIDIKYVKDVNINTKYSHLRLSEVGEKVDLNLVHGDAIIDALKQEFGDIKLDGRHANFELNVPTGAAFSLDAQTSYAPVSYPNGMVVTYEVEKNSSYQVKGYVNKKQSPRTVTARLTHGGLNIEQQ